VVLAPRLAFLLLVLRLALLLVLELRRALV